MKAPNPTDPIEYALIENFNRVGNVKDNPTPEFGADWDSTSNVLAVTNALGYLDLNALDTPGGSINAIHSVATKYKASFVLNLATAGKAFFFGARTGLITSRLLAAVAGDETLDIRLREQTGNLTITLLRYDPGTNTPTTIVNEAVIMPYVVGVDLAVTVEDTGTEYIVKVDNTVTTFSAANTAFATATGFMFFGGNVTNGIKIKKLRVW